MRLPRLLFPRGGLLGLGSAAAALNALLRVAVAPLLIAPLFDRVFLRGDFTALPQVLLLGALVIGGGSLALWAQDASFGTLAAKTCERWRAGLYARLLDSQEHPSQRTSGGLSGRLIADLKEIEVYLQYGLGSLIAESLTLCLSLLFLFFANVGATFMLLFTALPLTLLLAWAGRRIKVEGLVAQEALEHTASHMQEGLAQREVVRSFALTNFMLGRFAPANRRAALAQGKRARWAALQTPLAQLLGFAAVAFLLLILSRSVQQGQMTLGELTAFVTVLALLTTPAQLLPRAYAYLQSARAAAERLQSLAAEGAPAPLAADISLLEKNAGAVVLEIKAVSVREGAQRILDAVSASFKGPKLIAIVGESGGGKTTLLKVILGLIKTDGGQLSLNGVDLAHLPFTSRRAHLAYVPQDTQLFRGSLRENLTLGEEVADEVLEGVLQRLGLTELLAARTLDAPLQEAGRGLSGGQRQRFCVARALLREPQVLLLDEPSASLDSESERILSNVLLEESRRRLVIVVAHRPALVAAAAEVYLMEAGRLAKVAAQRRAWTTTP